MYVIYCNDSLELFHRGKNICFAETLKEAMTAFDIMTTFYNKYHPNEEYLTCAEMDCFTEADFEENVVGSQTDMIYVDTLEDYIAQHNEYFYNMRV